MRRQWLLGLFVLGIVGVAVVSLIGRKSGQRSIQSDIPIAEEYSVVSIPLEGPIADRKAEISGLAWWGDRLILLPQYPARMGAQIFALDKAKIVDWLEKQDEEETLSAEAIAFEDGGLSAEIDGFEGYEAIAFQGDTAFLTVESETRKEVLGYVVKGDFNEAGTALKIDASSRAEVPAQSTSPNKSEETLLLTDAQAISIYEVNGAQLNPNPVAHSFNFSLTEIALIPFPQIEYRITDATALDEQNRFWAINYFFPGDSDVFPEQDPIAERYGEGETHQQQRAVERLVEFVYTPIGIVLTDTPPMQLKLGEEARNWEGIVRLDERGFLLVTDKFPETILGFVEKVEAE